MSEEHGRLITAVIVRILRPLVRMLLRFNVPYHACAEALKWVYVDTAFRHFRIVGRKQTQARVSVITGLSRVEVRKQESVNMADAPPSMRRWHRAGRVLSGWAEDKTYLDADGSPRVLPVEGKAPSFYSLVDEHSGGSTYRSILDELNGAGAVAYDKKRETVTLLRPYYLTEARASDSQTLDVLGLSASHLLDTIEKNTRPERLDPFFQRLVIQERVPEALAEEARRYVRKRSQELANDVDRYLTGLVALHEEGDGEQTLDQLGLGIYYFETEDGSAGLDD